MIDDYDLIVASFRKEYGIGPREFKQMKWDEFRALLSGLGPDTALGRIVAIRSEDDPDTLKCFTDEQKRIRNEYRNKIAKEMPKEQLNLFLNTMKEAFIKMAGGMEAIISEKE